MKLLEMLAGSKKKEPTTFIKVYGMNSDHRSELFRDLAKRKFKHIELCTRDTMTILDAKNIALEFDFEDDMELLKIHTLSTSSHIEIKGVQEINHSKSRLIIVMYDSFLDV